ncbi:hypothetical protein HC931_04525 [Candidatus Gracilibacteria bacterium]|nr:hypothetical protein [Candidatus Gracilibacteria bacterium]NJM89046.1 hypothetical protein [Hydrococcus sp. RU_2_2]NJP19089.1 hypothetical protein [Hydrococcus sp. CRU_1_1]
MTGKVLNNGTAGILVLILPIAMALVVIFTAWPLLLVLIALAIGLKIWDNYQWQRWSGQLNPSFNQLIKDNKGALTVMDWSLKANLTGRAAQRFLERKAQEYGAQRKDYQDKGTVYYFLTVSALGTIFDDSELLANEEEAMEKPPASTTSRSVTSPPAPQKPSFSELAQLAHQKEETKPEPVAMPLQEAESVASPTVVEEAKPEPVKAVEIASPAPTPESKKLTLTQADLAKRLDIHPSTVGRRKMGSDFPEWSQSKDPEGVAWKYLAKTEKFVPVE